jgi:hypothetical protein
MRVLDMYSGNVGNVFKSQDWEVVMLDREMPADIIVELMDWDYMAYTPKHFDVIWASPPNKQKSESNEMMARIMEIIDYLQPRFYFIENPHHKLLNYHPIVRNRQYNDIDYCRYGLPCRKRVRIWNNLSTFLPLLCNRMCGKLNEDNNRHLVYRTKTSHIHRVPKALIEYLIRCIHEQLDRDIELGRHPPTELDFDNLPIS